MFNQTKSMNEVISRIKNSIDKSIIDKVDKSSMSKMKFVPVSIRQGQLFVAVSKKSNMDRISQLLKRYYPNPIRFMPVGGDDDLRELLSGFVEENKIDEDLPKVPQKKDAPVMVSEPVGGMLGELFVKKGLITQEQLDDALAESKRSNAPIGSTLYEMGYITLSDLKKTLGEQTGYKLVSSEQLQDQKNFINILPEDFIRTNSVIPISSDGRVLTVGVLKPLKQDILKAIIYITGQNPRQLLMTHYEFNNSLEVFFSKRKKQTERILEQIKTETIESEAEASLSDQLDAELLDSTGTVAKFVNQIITNAIDNKVSDIHIEPRLNGYIVRYRKDGILQKTIDIPDKAESSVITRFKVMSRMNIAEQRRPQDGTFTMPYKDTNYDFRINTLPVSGKEKVVIRILAPAVSLKSEDKQIKLVGANSSDLEEITKMVSCPNGIILTSGPTGSGKTTTLYSILKSLNDESVNITTIEDPIEIKLDGINQSQVNVKAGITFASCMRAILRQDPDIILIGEIRDYETLETAISAALTGHLVLSTIHTNSAAATVTRLIEMGAKDYLVSSTLSGVIAQRLVRRLCDDCKTEYHCTREEAMKVTLDEDEIEKLMKTPIYRATGCNHCNFTGYRGRLGIYEIMPITKEIKKLIAQGAHDLEIEECAVDHGMNTLSNSCLSHILQGHTTVSEFVRVLGLAGE